MQFISAYDVDHCEVPLSCHINLILTAKLCLGNESRSVTHSYI